MSKCPGQGYNVISLLSMVSKKWMLLVIRSIHHGAKSYSAIEKDNAGITPSTLSTRLKELQKMGFIEKNIVSETPIKIEYELTKKGTSFSEHIKQMCEWTEEWM